MKRSELHPLMTVGIVATAMQIRIRRNILLKLASWLLYLLAQPVVLIAYITRGEFWRGVAGLLWLFSSSLGTRHDRNDAPNRRR